MPPASTPTRPTAVAVLDAAIDLVVTETPGAIAALERAVTALVPAVGPFLGMLTPDCSFSPLKSPIAAGPVARPTSAELADLLTATEGASPWTGHGAVAGVARDLVVVVPSPARGPGVTVFAAGDPLDADAAALLQGLCDVVAGRYADRAGDAVPGGLLISIAAAQERARAVTEASEAHRSALRGVAAALRAEHLDDARARRTALDLVSTALVDIDAASEREQQLGSLGVAAAFAALGDEVRAITRDAAVAVELAPPEGDRDLAAGLAHALRVATRQAALALVDRGAGRLRIAWRLDPSALVATVRDDGDGAATVASVSGHGVAERVAEVGATLAVDAVPGWGTTVTISVPLAPVALPDPGPLAVLNDREREVLHHVALGLRNRQVAAVLLISDNTVKFHVANILRKLGVATRGEAAALVHR